MESNMGGVIKSAGKVLGIGGGAPGRTAPTPDDKLSRANKERKARRRYGDAGRVSTLLDDGKLG